MIACDYCGADLNGNDVRSVVIGVYYTNGARCAVPGSCVSLEACKECLEKLVDRILKASYEGAHAR